MDIENKLKYIEKDIYKFNKNVKLVVVTKKQPIENIQEAINAGASIIGESKWQEFKEKFVNNNVGTGRDLSVHGNNKNIQFHFIGHLQKNKVKDVIQYFDCIQSVDSLKLLEKINLECGKIDKTINIFLQINISNDKNKFGFKLNEIKNILVETHCNASLHNINLIGFMCITAKEETEKIREDYKSMKKLFDQYKKQYNLTELSMGMSNDYKIAVEEGTTMVRIGSAIFEF